ncbi:hypothetical protein UF75_0363 [Desulfosporosinus sp. I2]|nr:hypothetical protein UF75_0363 [Desulfosporosinus sp. I2]
MAAKRLNRQGNLVGFTYFLLILILPSYTINVYTVVASIIGID